MCAVSAMMDYGRTHIAVDQWDRPTFNEFKEVIARLEALDKKLDQPHCDDPAKSVWMQQIEARLRRLEGDDAV